MDELAAPYIEGFHLYSDRSLGVFYSDSTVIIACLYGVIDHLVDVGDEGRVRTVCSGLVEHVSLEQMQVSECEGHMIKSNDLCFYY